jgi:hypothetical protein
MLEDVRVRLDRLTADRVDPVKEPAFGSLASMMHAS